jgi:hypothetical protein
MKKSFAGGLSSILGDQPKQSGRGRPRTNFREVTKSSQEGVRANETRATFIIREDVLDKIKAIAYWDRLTIKQFMDSALSGAIETWEKANGGAVKPVPKR